MLALKNVASNQQIQLPSFNLSQAINITVSISHIFLNMSQGKLFIFFKNSPPFKYLKPLLASQRVYSSSTVGGNCVTSCGSILPVVVGLKFWKQIKFLTQIPLF